MCNCITEIEEKLTNIMVEQNSGCEVESPVSFKNVSWIFGEKSLMVLNNPILGKYRMGNKVKKWETEMIPTYCPFCGKKLDE